MPFSDRLLTCVDCRREFTFSADEQEYFDLKGFKNIPKRCHRCRALRQHTPLSPRRSIVETSVKCVECGIETIVPFRPTGSKPVYCAKCYRSKRSPGPPGTPLAV